MQSEKVGVPSRDPLIKQWVSQVMWQEILFPSLVLLMWCTTHLSHHEAVDRVPQSIPLGLSWDTTYLESELGKRARLTRGNLWLSSSTDIAERTGWDTKLGGELALIKSMSLSLSVDVLICKTETISFVSFLKSFHKNQTGGYVWEPVSYTHLTLPTSLRV